MPKKTASQLLSLDSFSGDILLIKTRDPLTQGEVEQIPEVRQYIQANIKPQQEPKFRELTDKKNWILEFGRAEGLTFSDYALEHTVMGISC